MTTNKTTSDGRTVYPSNAELPEGALGWTQCILHSSASYTTFCAPEDQARAAVDYKTVENAVNAIRTIEQCKAAMVRVGFLECQIGGKLKDMKVSLQVRLNANRWPLREVG